MLHGIPIIYIVDWLLREGVWARWRKMRVPKFSFRTLGEMKTMITRFLLSHLNWLAMVLMSFLTNGIWQKAMTRMLLWKSV
jgi:hypothetical protein